MARMKVGEFLLGGIPAAEWVGRMVLICGENSNAGGRNKVGARLLAIDGRCCCTVKPVGHGKTEVKDPSDVHPWWAKNPDLAARRTA